MKETPNVGGAKNPKNMGSHLKPDAIAARKQGPPFLRRFFPR